MPRNEPSQRWRKTGQCWPKKFAQGRWQSFDGPPPPAEGVELGLGAANGCAAANGPGAEVTHKRRTYTWTKEARDLVKAHTLAGSSIHKLITELAKISGHPRRVCVRFAHRMGFEGGRSFRKWTEQEIEEIKNSYSRISPRVLAARLHRPETSIRSKFKTLGLTRSMKEDQYTKYTLAELLHVRPELVQDWLDKKWLKFHLEGTKKLPRVIIYAQDFLAFCERYPAEVLGRRVDDARLEFLKEFLFARGRMDGKKKPPSSVKAKQFNARWRTPRSERR